jgi:hypothetical protein
MLRLITIYITCVSTKLVLEKIFFSGDALLLYTACSFETAWDHRAQSPWCAAFSESNMKVEMSKCCDVNHW